MDVPLLPPSPMSEYSREDTGARFTVHSAITRRLGMRRSKALSEKEEEGGEEANAEEVRGRRGGEEAPRQTDTNKEDSKDDEVKTETRSEGKGTPDPQMPVQFRAEWRRSDRSNSLDCRGGRCTRTGVLAFSGNLGDTAMKQDERLERAGARDRSRAEGTERNVMSRFKAYNSTGTGTVGGERSPRDRSPTGQAGPGLHHVTQVLERTSGAQSLPSRLRPQASSGLRETASSVGSKAGQSIWERIEKLYGSTGSAEDSPKAKRHSVPAGDWPPSEGVGREAGADRRRSTSDSSSLSTSSFPSSSPLSQWRGVAGSFPRHLSKGENNGPQGSQTTTCTAQADADSSAQRQAGSVLSAPMAPGGTREKATGAQWQGPTQGRRPGDGEAKCGGRGVLEAGTMSLDRGRSKFTVAARIRAARAEGTIAAAHTQPAGGGGDGKQMANDREGVGGVDEISEKEKEGTGSLALKVERIREREMEKGSDVKGGKEEKKGGENTTETSCIADDIFESGERKMGSKATERKRCPDKLVVPSAASVRNKIHQYEALAAQGSSAATAPFRRAFSVPSKLSRAREGVRKSGSDRSLGGLRERWEGLREEENRRTGEDVKGTGEGVKKSASAGRALTVFRIEVLEQDQGVQRGSIIVKSASVDEVVLGLGSRKRRGSDGVEVEGKQERSGGANSPDPDVGKYSRLKDKLQIPLEGGARRPTHKDLYIDETDLSKVTSPESPSKRDTQTNDTPSSLYSNSNNHSNGSLHTPARPEVQNKPPAAMPSPVSDEDKTPTNTPYNSPFLSEPLPGNTATTDSRDTVESPVSTRTLPADTNTSPPHLPSPLTSSSHGHLPDLVPVPRLKGGRRDENLDAWVANLNQTIEGWNCGEDDDEGTEKDDDSNYDSDSGGSSVTITSNMSQSDRRSFCLSLADLCNFGGVEYESETDSDEWSSGRRSASLSSDVSSALSCVSVLASEELERLLEDVRGLGENTLQNHEDVQVVVLHKEVGVGLGFTMAGGVDQNKPITVHKVFPFGVAAQEGSIREGDRVLSINGTALCGCAHWEALRTVRRARTRGMGVVVLRRGGIGIPSKGGGGAANTQEQTQTQSTGSGQRVCLRLEKRSRDLGFSLEGGVGSNLGDRPLSIQKIFQGGPVSEVLPGDEVLEIEGVSMVGMRRLEAWTLIRRLPAGPVNVVLHRPLKPLEP